MAQHNEKLGKFLGEAFNWAWSDFVKAERNKDFTSNQAIVFALIRACAMQQLGAIKLSLNRLDGKIKTPVRIEYPKMYFLFPNDPRSTGELQAPAEELALPEAPTEALMVSTPDSEPEDTPDLTKMGLRETLSRMSDFSRALPEAIIAAAQQTEQWVGKRGLEPKDIPKVKSVVAAHLLVMAQNRNLDALTEVFDQIDGRLVETFQILGADVYISNYSTKAPPGAVLNEQGILQLEATQAQDHWAAKLQERQIK